MDLILAKALGGKYFINQLHAQHGPGLLMRGKILGPIANELSPYYLCDLFPINDTEIGVTAQTVLSLEQLSGVYLYEDKLTQDAAWTELQRQRLAAIERRKKAEAAAPKVMFGRMPKELAEALGVPPDERENEETRTEEPPK